MKLDIPALFAAKKSLPLTIERAIRRYLEDGNDDTTILLVRVVVADSANLDAKETLTTSASQLIDCNDYDNDEKDGLDPERLIRESGVLKLLPRAFERFFEDFPDERGGIYVQVDCVDHEDEENFATVETKWTNIEGLFIKEEPTQEQETEPEPAEVS